MKKIILISIILCLSIPQINAQEISQKDNSYIDNMFLSKLTIYKQKIDSDTLAKVFKGNFYLVDPKISLEDQEGTYSCRKLISINEGVIKEIIDSSIVILVKENFLLKNEEDVIIFETALDKLYPLQEEDKEYKEHLKSGNNWYFIRGEFFGAKSGYKVTINQDSKITGIVYDLEAIVSK
jgi:hypothetical protein